MKLYPFILFIWLMFAKVNFVVIYVLTQTQFNLYIKTYKTRLSVFVTVEIIIIISKLCMSSLYSINIKLDFF